MRINANRHSRPPNACFAGRLSVHAFRDSARFWRYSALSVFDSSKEQLTGRIMYNVHALEKGLAQSENWSPGRGARRSGTSTMRWSCTRGRATIVQSSRFCRGGDPRRYTERHYGLEESIGFLTSIVDPLFLGGEASGGCRSRRHQDRAEGRQSTECAKGFAELAQGRPECSCVLRRSD